MEYSLYYYRASQMTSQIIFIKKENLVYAIENAEYDDEDFTRVRELVIDIEDMDENIKNIYESSKCLTGKTDVNGDNVNIEHIKNWKYLYLTGMDTYNIDIYHSRLRWEELSSQDTIKLLSRAWYALYGKPLNFIKTNSKNM